MAGNLGTLTLDLIAKTGNFTGPMDQAARLTKKNSDKMKAEMKALGVAFVAAGTAAATAIGFFVKSTIDAADDALKLSQAVGLSVESFQSLAFAAKLGGVEQEAFAKAIGKLSVTMADAGSGLKTQAAYFDALGISVFDATGKMRSSEDVLLDIADLFSTLEDGVDKSAIAMKVFGRTGATLIPTLNLGRAGIQALQEQAESLGIVIGEKSAKQAEIFNDSLTVLSAVSKGFWSQVTVQLLPAMNHITEALIDLTKDGTTAAAVAGALANTMKVLANVAVVVAGTFDVATQSIRSMFETALILTKSANLKASDFLFGPTLFAKLGKSAKDNLDEAAEASKRADGQLEKTLTKYSELLAKINAPADVEGDQALEESIKSKADLIKSLNESLGYKTKEENEALKEQNALLKEGEAVTKSVRTEVEIYTDQIARLNELLDAGVISQETFSRASTKAQEELAESTEKLFGSFQEGFGVDLITSSDQFFGSFSKSVGEATKQASSMFSSTTTAIIFGQKKAGEGFKELGLSLAQMFVEMGINMLTQQAIALISSRLIGATVSSTMAGIAAAAAPAAALTSLASFGGNSAPAIAGMTSAAATSAAIAATSVAAGIPGAATGGNVTVGGSVLIGEKGPEILNLPRGAQVVPLDRAPRGDRSINVTMHIQNVNANNETELRSLARMVSQFIDEESRV